MSGRFTAATKCAEGTPGCVDGYNFPKRRYDFIRALAAAQAQHPDLKLDERVGFQPWQVEEVWQRLKSDLREYRKEVAANEDTSGVETAILFDAGWLGHYVADGSQPLHLTIQYNGWTGPNPNGYTTEHKIHSQFESVYVSANIKAADVAPLVTAAQPVKIDDEWTQYWKYLDHSNGLVEKVYQLEKAGGFNGAGTPEAKAFHGRAAGGGGDRAAGSDLLGVGAQRGPGGGVSRAAMSQFVLAIRAKYRGPSPTAQDDGVLERLGRDE